MIVLGQVLRRVDGAVVGLALDAVRRASIRSDDSGWLRK
jgi:hypothetical protein